MKRDYRIDLLRVLSILAVLGIHCFGGKGHAANYINGFCRFSVPVFVMISAICCAPKLSASVPLKSFYKPRFARVGIPLLAFSLLYMAENVFAGSTVAGVMKSFILGKPSYHLWFGFMIIGVYVFIPFLVQLEQQINRWLLGGISVFVILMTWDVGGGLYSILPFVAYAMTGLLLRPVLDAVSEDKPDSEFQSHAKFTKSEKFLWKRMFVGLFCLGIYILCSSIVGSIGTNKAYTYTSIYSLMGSIAVLVGAYALLPRNIGAMAGRLLSVMASCAFGVYLFHVIAIRGILRIIPSLRSDGIVPAAILWCLVVGVSFSITLIASKIPFVRTIFGMQLKKENRQ